MKISDRNITIKLPNVWDIVAFLLVMGQVTLLACSPSRKTTKGFSSSRPVTQLAGLMEALAAEPYNGRADIPKIADQMGFGGDQL